ncbi:synaptonemal complex protein 1-like isoform X1, partial [Clarias magur]
FKEDVRLLRNERETTNVKHEKKIKRLRKQVKKLCFEMWSLQVEQNRQGEETTELTCHNRALEQQLEDSRCFLQLKDDLINQIKHKVERAERVK